MGEDESEDALEEEEEDSFSGKRRSTLFRWLEINVSVALVDDVSIEGAVETIESSLSSRKSLSALRMVSRSSSSCRGDCGGIMSKECNASPITSSCFPCDRCSLKLLLV